MHARHPKQTELDRKKSLNASRGLLQMGQVKKGEEVDKKEGKRP